MRVAGLASRTGGGNDFNEDTINNFYSLSEVYHSELHPQIKAWHNPPVDNTTLRYQDLHRAGWAAANRMFEEEG
ncbi:hypothetical protein FRC08_014707, partial [Ceratobasidium sp. 394]